MEIKYIIKNRYGNDDMYVVDKDIAEAIQQLTKRKTIRKEDMAALEKLGITFIEVKL